MRNITMDLLHPSQSMDLYKIESTMLEIDYVSHYDHMNFGVRFKDACFSELTNYPYTIDPQVYSQNP